MSNYISRRRARRRGRRERHVRHGRGWRGRTPVRRGEPTGRAVRQRPAVTQRRASAHRRAGPARHPALRHQQTAEGLARLRLQNPGSLSRDRVHLARRHRRFQAQSHDAEGGVVHQAVESERPRHFCVGDPRPAAGGRRLRQVQRALGVVHQPNPAQQTGGGRGRGAAAVPGAPAVRGARATLLAPAPALRLLRVLTGTTTRERRGARAPAAAGTAAPPRACARTLTAGAPRALIASGSAVAEGRPPTARRDRSSLPQLRHTSSALVSRTRRYDAAID